jgi:HK97 family phage prohead protease
MSEKILKFYRAEIKGVDEENFSVDAIVSTKKPDRSGDIVEPEAFRKRKKTYMEHPALVSSHDYGDLRKIIGECVSLKINDDDVTAKFKYYVGKGNPEADWAWELARTGNAAYSIGFISHEAEEIKDKDDRWTGRKFTEIELLEISQVVVPANAGALQLMRNSAEFVETVMKSMDSGTLKAPVQTKPVIEKATTPEEPIKIKAPENKDVHYSEVILGDADSKQNPEHSPDEDKSTSDVIKETIKEIINNGNKRP